MHVKKMSRTGKAALYIIPAVASVAGVVVTGYYTYKSFQTKKCAKEADSRSSESFCTACDYESGSEYFDAQDQWTNDLEKDFLFEMVDKLMQGDKSGIEAAYSKMEELENCHTISEDPNFLWRYAKLHHLMGKVNENEARELNKKDFLGLKYAKKAVNNDPKNPEAHKWFAILTGKEAKFVNNNAEKAEKGKIFFKHIQEALKLNREDWELHHLLGVFEYELASLNAFKKVFASQIFKGISTCDYRVAKNYFETAEKYNTSSSKETKLFLAKCLCVEKKYEEALKVLHEALDLKVKSAEDMACHSEVDNYIKDIVRQKNPF